MLMHMRCVNRKILGVSNYQNIHLQVDELERSFGSAVFPLTVAVGSS
jgi:hypothetical protein